ncbi:MAG: hypothetical protein KF805_11195 [Phycisphaeraceae bacterium]|nr:hypothetical protein [Phycisphaeraceae bacterium]
MRCCCNGDESVRPKSVARWPRHVVAFIEWALPITTLALVPKCPGCVAAYVLLFTGLGISFEAAAATRWTLIGLCVAALGYVLVKSARRVLAWFASRGYA